MADIIMKIQQDNMALLFLIVEVFGSLYTQIHAAFSSESTGVFSYSCQCRVKKLSAKNIGTLKRRMFFFTSADGFSPITFKLDFKKKFLIHHWIQGRFLYLLAYL